jgi:hypothetical protein
MRFLEGIRRFFSTPKDGSWALLGAALGLALTVTLEGFFHAEWPIAITAGISFTTLMALVGEVFHREQLSEIIKDYSKLRKYRDLRDRINDLIGFYILMQNFGHKLFANRFQTELEGFISQAASLAKGNLYVDINDDLLFTIDILEGKKIVKASSWRDSLDYWNSKEGRAYIAKNKNLIVEKKAEITRIFILKAASAKLYKKIIDEQKSFGVVTKIAIEQSLPKHCIQDFVIYDNKEVKQEELIEGFRKVSNLIIDPYEVSKYVQRFRELDQISEDSDKYYKNLKLKKLTVNKKNKK